MTNSADDAVEVKPSSTSLHTQLVRFISVGVFTAAIDYGLTLLLTYLGLHRSAAEASGWHHRRLPSQCAVDLWGEGIWPHGRDRGHLVRLYLCGPKLPVLGAQ